MRIRSILFANLALILTACSSAPQSYLPAGDKPIINIESSVAPLVNVSANAEKLEINNLTEQALSLDYKLFWYDVEGVTQGLNPEQSTLWQPLLLAAKAQQRIALTKPTPESAKYRLYLRGHQ